MIPLQSLTPPVIAAVAGALLGSFFTLIIQLYLRRLRQEEKQRNLRLAFGAELSDLGEALDWAAGSEMNNNESKTFLAALPMTVYDTRCGDLGLLTEDELTAIIRFYDSLTAASAISEAEIAHEFDDEFDLEYSPSDLLVRHRDAVSELWPYLSADAQTLGLENPEERDANEQSNEERWGDEIDAMLNAIERQSRGY